MILLFPAVAAFVISAVFYALRDQILGELYACMGVCFAVAGAITGWR